MSRPTFASGRRIEWFNRIIIVIGLLCASQAHAISYYERIRITENAGFGSIGTLALVDGAIQQPDTITLDFNAEIPDRWSYADPSGTGFAQTVGGSVKEANTYAQFFDPPLGVNIDSLASVTYFYTIVPLTGAPSMDMVPLNHGFRWEVTGESQGQASYYAKVEASLLANANPLSTIFIKVEDSDGFETITVEQGGSPWPEGEDDFMNSRGGASTSPMRLMVPVGVENTVNLLAISNVGRPLSPPPYAAPHNAFASASIDPALAFPADFEFADFFEVRIEDATVVPVPSALWLLGTALLTLLVRPGSTPA